MKFWSIAQVYPPNLKKAEHNLSRQGFDFYSPMYIKKQRLFGSQRLPLFPGYVFVYIVDQWRALLSTYGVSGLLLSAGEPAKVPADVVDNIKAREVDGVVVLSKSRFYVGQQVQVKSGPLGYELGTIHEGQRDRDRVKVLLNLLGRSCVVAVEEDNLVAV